MTDQPLDVFVRIGGRDARAGTLWPEQAKEVIREVIDATASWRDVAEKHGAARRELELMADAFESPAAIAIREAVQ
jgi:hypothetical protein